MIPPNQRRRYHTCVLVESVILQPGSGSWDRALDASERVGDPNELKLISLSALLERYDFALE